MISYVIKRILKAIPLMIVLSIILFFIIGGVLILISGLYLVKENEL